MFYDNLKAICEEQGLKVTPIVLECGGKSGSISGWKKGSWPSSELVVSLSARLNVSTDRLLTGRESEKVSSEFEGIGVDGLRVGLLWEQLDEPGRAIILGEMYKRLESRSKETNAETNSDQRAGRVG